MSDVVIIKPPDSKPLDVNNVCVILHRVGELLKELPKKSEVGLYGPELLALEQTLLALHQAASISLAERSTYALQDLARTCNNFLQYYGGTYYDS